MVKTVPDGRIARTGVVLREDDSKVGGRKLTGVHAAAAARAATENEQTSFSIKHMSNSSKIKSFYSTSQFNLSYEKHKLRGAQVNRK